MEERDCVSLGDLRWHRGCDSIRRREPSSGIAEIVLSEPFTFQIEVERSDLFKITQQITDGVQGSYLGLQGPFQSISQASTSES